MCTTVDSNGFSASSARPARRNAGGEAPGRHDRIYETLRTRISLLDHAPGEWLSEEALAEEFGVSRTPIRRVLGRLEAEGLLRSVKGVGTLVTELDFKALSEVYRLRLELSALVGRLDPVPGPEAALARLHAILAEARLLGDAPETRRFAQVNIDFFHAVMELTSNAPLREIEERLYYLTTRIWIHSLDHADLAEEAAAFRRELADVIAAVELGDLASVGLIRRSHISMSFHRLRRKMAAT